MDIASAIARQATFQTETLQRAILDSASFAIIATDAKGVIQLFNVGAERLLGYRASDLVDKFTPSDIHDSQEVITRAEGLSVEFQTTIAPGFGALAFKASRGIEDRYELTYIRKDGSRFPAQVSITALRDEHNTVIGYLLIGADNSAAQIAIAAAAKEKLAQEILHQERQRLDRLKDEFVSTVSHELRTPLTSISGSLGLLVGGAAGTLPEPAARLLAIAQSNSNRLVRLVNDILDIERMASGQMAFQLEVVEARVLAVQVIENNRGFADLHRVRVRLATGASAGEVHADPDRLSQVVTNLLSNAIKFSPPDGEVEVMVEKRDDVIRISVRDHGPGIPADFKAHVFDKFAQADATDARSKGGTGLGLSIVQEIVTRLGGTVSFDDAPNGGTVFHVDLASH
jgi:signal transduction histidine kinase